MNSSSYYRETLGAPVENGAPLATLPILTKRTLIENYKRIVTDPRVDWNAVEQHLDGTAPGTLLFDRYRVFATGGTTGERGLFLYDDDAWMAVVSNALRFQKFLGIDEHTRLVSVFASSPIHLSYRISAELRSVRRSAPKLNVLMPIAEIVEALNAYQPEVLATYPSFVRTLASEQLAGRLAINPRLFRTSAETLTEDVRALAESVFKAKVVNSYSCTEAGFIGLNCAESDGIHIAEDLFVLEVVDEENQPVPDGTQGAKLLLTTLTNRTLPLVRYEISDLVTKATGPCSCGLPFWRLASIEGRREELLEFLKNDGTIARVHALRLRTPILKIPGVRQVQFAQLSNGVEVISAVAPEANVDELKSRIELATTDALKDYDPAENTILVTVVDRVERLGVGAKEKLVVTRTENQRP